MTERLTSSKDFVMSSLKTDPVLWRHSSSMALLLTTLRCELTLPRARRETEAAGAEVEGDAAEEALTTEEEVEEADTMIGEEDMMTEEVAADITMIEVG